LEAGANTEKVIGDLSKLISWATVWKPPGP
jgi:hypothetical protein